jgi:hypothetical protein
MVRFLLRETHGACQSAQARNVEPFEFEIKRGTGDFEYLDAPRYSQGANSKPPHPRR